jgi:hypothetical protein
MIQQSTNSVMHARPAEVIYSDVPAALQTQAVENMARQSHSALTFESTFSPWECVPAHYVFCEDDVTVPIEVQKGMMSVPGKWSSSSVQTGHSPCLVVPDEVAGIVDRFVRSIDGVGGL